MTFITAEVGINHNGSVDLAKRIIEAAKWAGADAVKLQKRTVEIVYAGQLEQIRESPWGNTLGDQKRGLELSSQDYDEIDRFCREIKIPWFASAWDHESLSFLDKYDLPFMKIASAMVTNWGFVAAVAKRAKPVFMSTAMCTDQMLFQAMGYFDGRLEDVTLMHCIGMYPAPEWSLNLQAIPYLHAKFGVKVGYSGHENSVSPSVVAAALGAVVIERHLTIDRTMYGSDQAASLEPHGLKTLVEQIRKVPVVMGDGVRKILPGEVETSRKLRYFDKTQGVQVHVENHVEKSEDPLESRRKAAIDPNRRVVLVRDESQGGAGGSAQDGA